MRFTVQLLLGCSGTDPGGIRTQVWTMFPFDGGRIWTCVSTDPELSYTLLATSSGEPEGQGIYTLVSTTTCFGVDPA